MATFISDESNGLPYLMIKETPENSGIERGSHFNLIMPERIQRIKFGNGYTVIYMDFRKQWVICPTDNNNESIDQLQCYNSNDPNFYDNDPDSYVNCDHEVIHQFIEVIRRFNHIEKVETDEQLCEFFEGFKIYLTTQEIEDYPQNTNGYNPMT